MYFDNLYFVHAYRSQATGSTYSVHLASQSRRHPRIDIEENDYSILEMTGFYYYLWAKKSIFRSFVYICIRSDPMRFTAFISVDNAIVKKIYRE